MRAVWGWLLLALVWAAPGRPARAEVAMQVDSPLAKTTTPLNLVMRLGRWFPVAITLTNTGEAARGDLIMQLRSSSGWDQGRDVNISRTPVDLPPNSRKRYWLYGRTERLDADAVRVSLQLAGAAAQTVLIPLTPVHENTRLVLTLSAGEERLSFLGQMQGPGLGLNPPEDAEENVAPAPAQSAVQPLGTAPEWMPNRWVGLEIVDLVVLHDFPHATLSPAQVASLRDYVAMGGNLLALGGNRRQVLAQSPLQALWAVQPAATATASATVVGGLVRRYVTRFPLRGEDRLGGAPVLLLRGDPLPATRTVLQLGGEPLLYRRAYGAGQSLLLAFDPAAPPFLGWSGQQELWTEIFAACGSARGMPGVDLLFKNSQTRFAPSFEEDDTRPWDRLLQELDTAQQLKTPPVSAIAWFLAIYIFILVPVNYTVLRVLDRRELAWITIPVIVLIFSCLSYFAALRIKGSEVLSRQVSIVQGSIGSVAWRVDTVHWLFSPRKTSYQVTTSHPHGVVSDLFRDDDATPLVLYHPAENAALRVEDAAINMWDRRVFVGQQPGEAARPVSLTMENGAPRVTNPTPWGWRSAVLVAGPRIFSLGAVPAGESSRRASVHGRVGLGGDYLARIQQAAEFSRLYPAHQGRLAAALAVALGDDFGTSDPGVMLIAFTCDDLAPLQISVSRTRREDYGVVIFRAAGINPQLFRQLTGTAGQVTVQKTATFHPDTGGIVSQYNIHVPAGEAGPFRVNATGHRLHNWQLSPPGGAEKSFPQGVVKLEAWHGAKRQWRPLAGANGGENAPAGQKWETHWVLPRSTIAPFVNAEGELRLRLSARGKEIVVQQFSFYADAT